VIPSIEPQPGPQQAFLETEADIAFYGGAAGGGKSYAILLDPLRNIQKKMGAIFFRKTYPMIMNLDGLWDKAEEIYGLCGAIPKPQLHEWKFKQGLRCRFSHLQYTKDLADHQGASYPLIYFDELTHFEEREFWSFFHQNRAVNDVPARIRATMNADSESWVFKLVSWYIKEDGYPDLKRSGVIRWFLREGDDLLWFDKKPNNDATSFTFIPSNIEDNKILLKRDPAYLRKLKALPMVERERLLKGNWKIRPSAGLYFRHEWLRYTEALSHDVLSTVRFWDRAASEKKQGTDPDYTVGLKLSQMASGQFQIEDVVRFRASPFQVVERIKNIAHLDGQAVHIGLEEEPGASGKSEIAHLIAELAGFNVQAFLARGDKITRAGPISAQCEAGNVICLKEKWTDSFLNELINFPEGKHDDQVDALSGAFQMLSDVKRPRLHSI